MFSGCKDMFLHSIWEVLIFFFYFSLVFFIPKNRCHSEVRTRLPDGQGISTNGSFTSVVEWKGQLFDR